MNDKQINWMRNVAGPAIFAIGALAVVLVLMILVKGMPVEGARQFDALARGLVLTLGTMPLALMGVGFAFLGARLFVVGPDSRLGKNLVGVTLTCLGFSIFLSAVLPDAGGSFGEAIGGRVRQTHAALAFIVGVVALAAPVWFLFVREHALEFLSSAQQTLPEKTQEEIEAVGGLSQAEADALLPESEVVASSETDAKSGELAQLLATQKDRIPEWLEESSYPQASSPYGEDVRSKGEIPEGAVPLETESSLSHDDSQSTPQSSTVQRWTPESLRLAGDALGADLAEAESAPSEPEAAPSDLLAEDYTEFAREPEVELIPEPAPEPVIEELPASVEGEALSTESEPEVSLEAEEEPTASSGEPVALPVETVRPAPSWEQADLFQEPDTSLEDEESEETAAELDDEEEWEYEEVDEDEELDSAAEYEDEEDEAAEYEEEEEYEDEEELDPAAEYEEEEEEDPSAEYEEDEEEDADEEDPAAEYEEEDSEEELIAEREEAEEPATEYKEEPFLEHAEETESAELEVEDSEPDVVLTPQAPPAAEVEGTSSERVTDDVIYASGKLFLERDRVAVSMLQREFNLDFDESCEVMDHLQEMGLIGPYVGGHRRDILMTKDQWMERVTAP